MNREAKNRLDARARIIKALGHPSRLFMIERLATGECCVCELTAMIGANISTVSKHLALLKQAGLVADRKEGLKVFYRLRVPCIMKFFECIEAVQRAGRPAAPAPACRAR